jgi:glyoxylase-like metal-dependent hydrolase (beta-lactamase superfamily II)
MRLTLVMVLGALLVVASWWRGGAEGTVAAQARGPAGTGHSGNAFRFNKVREGVYHAVGTGALTVVGNSSVIVNDDDVVIVDDHVSPAAAHVLLQEVKQLTSKPVRYVINTHFHFDHAHGNQVFGRGVDIIGHEFTRQMLTDNRSVSMPLFQNYLKGLPGAIADLRTRVAAEKDPAARAKLRAQLTSAENNLASQKEFRPVPPNVTLKDQMTLWSGSREIQVRFLGRAHTAGDVVVFLPRERVVITGDFLTAALSNMSDGFVDEWVDTLENLKKLDFEVVLPGHGEAFTDRNKIDYFQAYLRDVWTEMGRLKREGVSVEEAAKRVDLTKHRDHFPGIQGPGIPLIGAQRIYAMMDAPPRR